MWTQFIEIQKLLLALNLYSRFIIIEHMITQSVDEPSGFEYIANS